MPAVVSDGMNPCPLFSQDVSPDVSPVARWRPVSVLLLGGLSLELLLAPAGLLPLARAQAAPSHHGSSAPAAAKLSVTLLVLAQMQGHLLMAQELIEAGQVNAAEPHVGHPVDELYGSVAPALALRGVAPFLGTLEELRQQIRLNPTAPETGGMLRRAQQAIDAATAAMVSGDGSSEGAAARSVLLQGVVRELAQSAVEEYGSAVAGDRVVEVIDYQDARGFLRQGLQLTSQHRADGAAWQAMERTLQSMLQAFPSAMPPARTLLNAAELQVRQRQL